MPPYCGGKEEPPRGRSHATSPTQCARQIRAYGKRVVRDDTSQQEATNAGLRMSDGKGRKCGRKNSPNARQGNCSRQHRLYGLLPIISSRLDVHRQGFFARTLEEHVNLPNVTFATNHPYTVRAYHGINGAVNKISRGTVFCSVVWKDAEHPDAAKMNPQMLPDGVGFGFGYFAPHSRTGDRSHIHFYIVHVFVNPPFRRGEGGGAHVSSIVVEEFVEAVKYRARHELHANKITFTIDPEAKCFQLGNTQYMTERQSQSFEDMYTNAGFEVIPLPSEGRNRRRVQLVVDL